MQLKCYYRDLISLKRWSTTTYTEVVNFFYFLVPYFYQYIFIPLLHLFLTQIHLKQRDLSTRKPSPSLNYTRQKCFLPYRDLEPTENDQETDYSVSRQEKLKWKISLSRFHRTSRYICDTISSFSWMLHRQTPWTLNNSGEMAPRVHQSAVFSRIPWIAMRRTQGVAIRDAREAVYSLKSMHLGDDT